MAVPLSISRMIISLWLFCHIFTHIKYSLFYVSVWFWNLDLSILLLSGKLPLSALFRRVWGCSYKSWDAAEPCMLLVWRLWHLQGQGVGDSLTLLGTDTDRISWLSICFEKHFRFMFILLCLPCPHPNFFLSENHTHVFILYLWNSTPIISSEESYIHLLYCSSSLSVGPSGNQPFMWKKMWRYSQQSCCF